MASTIIDPSVSATVVYEPPIVARLLDGGKMQLLPNLQVTNIGMREGVNPGQAQFHYLFGDNAPGYFPKAIEQILPNQNTGPYVLKPDDRIVVFYLDDDGNPYFLFDGFCQIPEASLNPQGEQAHVQALATPVRCWDDYVKDAYYRDASKKDDKDENDETNLRVLFNPGGKGNASPEDADADVSTPVGGNTYTCPIFYDPDAPDAREWTISMFVKYILANHNDEEYVTNPDFTDLEALFDAWEPKPDGGEIDPEDPDTYDAHPITLPDSTDATGMQWPEAIFEAINPHGFEMCWRLDSTGMKPTWRIDFVRASDPAPLREKYLYHMPRGTTTLDPAQNNADDIKVVYDASMLINAYTTAPAPALVEASFMLAPLFKLDPADVSNKARYIETDPGFKDHVNDYRVYGIDETGEGFWDLDKGEWVEDTIPDLKAILSDKEGKVPFTVRYRKPRATLLSKDTDGKHRKSTLSYIKVSDYKAAAPEPSDEEETPPVDGNVPGIWDGRAPDKFQLVKGDYTLSETRLAIRLTGDDPSKFHFSEYAKAARGGTMPIVEWLNNKDDKFYFRLTTVIEVDSIQYQEVNKSKETPTKFRVRRLIDAKDRYKPTVISVYSEWNPDDKPIRPSDPAKDALADAEVRRFATELPPFAGPQRIPYLSRAYRIGDRIKGVAGRGIRFDASTGGRHPAYPRVVGIEWMFPEGDGQAPYTVLHLSDRRVSRERRRRR